jgi:hypothetical protein
VNFKPPPSHVTCVTLLPQMMRSTLFPYNKEVQRAPLYSTVHTNLSQSSMLHVEVMARTQFLGERQLTAATARLSCLLTGSCLDPGPQLCRHFLYLRTRTTSGFAERGLEETYFSAKCERRCCVSVTFNENAFSQSSHLYGF